jgi:hypothetical protein
MVDYTLAIPFAVGLIRNIAGWAENSLKDATIQAYEWGQLGKTIIETAVLAFAAVWGLGLDAASASGVAVLISYGLSALKKIGK